MANPTVRLNTIKLGIHSVTFSYNKNGFEIPADTIETNIAWDDSWTSNNLNEGFRTGTSNKIVYDRDNAVWSWNFSGAYNGSSNSPSGEITVTGLFSSTEYTIKGTLSASVPKTTYTYTYYQHRERTDANSSWIYGNITRIKTETSTDKQNCGSASATLTFTTTAFKWAKDPAAGGSISEAITADKWNELGSYLGINKNVSKGATITADLYNEYADVLNVSRVNEKTIIKAQHFIDLQNAINSGG